MKFVLATAAAMAIAGSASAADMARKAPAAVDYVKVCDTYGAGFFYIPGTETCLKIGGYVRAQATTVSGDLAALGIKNYGDARTQNAFSTRSRLNLTVDARSNTDFGVLRAFGSVNAEVNSGVWGGSSMGANSNAVTLDKAYIAWGGLTAGYATSKFDFFTGYNAMIGGGEIAHDDTVNLLAYTFSVGNGVSATLSVEDPTFAGRAGVMGGTPAQVYGGLKMPDIVGNINISQAWGSAQLMGVLHNIYTTDVNATTGVDKWGYAVGAGVKVNLPSLGAGDEAGVQVVYGNGATRYIAGQWGMYDYNATNNELGSGWSVQTGLTHNFSSSLGMNVSLAYLNYDDPAAAGAFDYTVWTAGASLVWKPAANLAITAGVEYAKRDFDIEPTTGTDRSGDSWGAIVRIQRSF